MRQVASPCWAPVPEAGLAHSGRRAVLVVGSANQRTGFGRVSDGILAGLNSHFQVHQLAVDLPRDRFDRPWPVHGNPVGVDRFGEIRLRELVGRLAPLIVLVGDIANLGRYIDVLETLSSSEDRLPLVAYCAVDGDIEQATVLRAAARAARLVAFTEAGKHRLSSGWASTRVGLPGRTSGELDIDVIGHGVDHRHARAPALSTAHEHAKEDSYVHRGRRLRSARQHLGWTLPEDAVVILNISRNQIRKRLDLTLHAFALLLSRAAPTTSPAYLYLHCEERTAVGGNVRALAHQLGIAHRLLLPGDQRPGLAASEADLDLLYRACDIGVNTALGESWNLATFEHARTGAPQVLVSTSVTRELWGAAALLVPGRRVPLGTLYSGTEVDPRKVGAALLLLHANPDRRATEGRRCAAQASRPEYRWQSVDRKWQTLIAGVLKDPALQWT